MAATQGCPVAFALPTTTTPGSEWYASRANRQRAHAVLLRVVAAIACVFVVVAVARPDVLPAMYPASHPEHHSTRQDRSPDEATSTATLTTPTPTPTTQLSFLRTYGGVIVCVFLFSATRLAEWSKTLSHRGYTRAQVAKHCTAESCWVIVDDSVYDITDFLPKHPPGPQRILPHAGKDATRHYNYHLASTQYFWRQL